MAKRKKIGSNFQWGSTGRGKTDKAITIKVRQNKRTKSVNVRCGTVKTEACEVAKRLASKAMDSIADAQETDEERKAANKRAIERKTRHKGGPTPF